MDERQRNLVREVEALEVFEVDGLRPLRAELAALVRNNIDSHDEQDDARDDVLDTLALGAEGDLLAFHSIQFRGAHAEEARAVPQNQQVRADGVLERVLLNVQVDVVCFLLLVGGEL